MMVGLGKEGRKRERDIADWGEEENRDEERKQRGWQKRSAFVDFD